MHYDLIIIGGGLVGAGLAVALRDSPLQIALVDARLPSNDDPRLFALNHSSCQFLTNLGLWPALAAFATPIHQVHVSYQKHFGAVRLNREEVNLQALGHVIPAYTIETALNTALLSLSNVTLYRPATLKSLQQHNDLASLTIHTHEGEVNLHAPLVMGADGTESTVRKQLDLTTTVFDYQQSAIVTRTVLKRSHGNIAYERFTAEGAIAMLPLGENECATIWTANTETITHLMSLSEQDFLQTLQQTFGHRLGSLQQIRHRHVFPLRMLRADKSVQGCVFLLGNSAHTLHPIAAQGFNLAIYEVAALAESILEKTAKKRMCSTLDLQRVNEKIQKQQATSIGLSHHLSTIFTHHSRWMSLLLPFAMIGFDVATPLKKKFIKGLLGRTGRVPRLLLSANE